MLGTSEVGRVAEPRGKHWDGERLKETAATVGAAGAREDVDDVTDREAALAVVCFPPSVFTSVKRVGLDEVGMLSEDGGLLEMTVDDELSLLVDT